MHAGLVVCFTLIGLWGREVSAIGMGFSYQCSLRVLPECKLAQIQNIKALLEQKLGLQFSLAQEQQRIDQIEYLLAHLTVFLEEGLLQEKSVTLVAHLPAINYLSYQSQKSALARRPAKAEKGNTSLVQSKFLSTLLGPETGGGLALAGQGLIVINQDLFPAEFLPMILVHEVGEIIFQNHFQATVIEYLYAGKRKMRSQYLAWLKTYPYYVHKMQNTFVEQHWQTLLADVIGRNQLPSPFLYGVNNDEETFLRHRDWMLMELLHFAGDESGEEWEAKVPQAVITAIKQLEGRSKKLQRQMDQLFRELRAKIRGLHPKKGDLASQLAVLDQIFFKMIGPWRPSVAAAGPIDLVGMTNYWRQHQRSLKDDFIIQLNKIKDWSANHQQYLAWLLAAEGNDWETRPYFRTTWRDVGHGRSDNCAALVDFIFN